MHWEDEQIPDSNSALRKTLTFLLVIVIYNNPSTRKADGASQIPDLFRYLKQQVIPGRNQVLFSYCV